jgi:hypothetical protein
VLLEQVKSRTKDVRAAALTALGRCDADEAARALGDSIRRDDLALAVEPLRRSRHPIVVSALLDAAEAQYESLIGGKETDAKTLGPKVERMCLLLDCLKGREDRRTAKLLLTMFDDMARLAAIECTPSGNDVIERLVRAMATGTRGVRNALVDAHGELSADLLDYAFVAARWTRAPAEVFALFSPYLAADGKETRKARGTRRARREAVIDQLMDRRYRLRLDADKPLPAAGKLDPRWLDVALQLGNAELILVLALPGHAGAREVLTSLFRQTVGSVDKEYQMEGILDTMIRVEHPGATDAVVEAIRKFAVGKSRYGLYWYSNWVARLIPRLPRAEALPKLEALLPTLPEEMADRLIDALTELK